MNNNLYFLISYNLFLSLYQLVNNYLYCLYDLTALSIDIQLMLCVIFLYNLKYLIMPLNFEVANCYDIYFNDCVVYIMILT